MGVAVGHTLVFALVGGLLPYIATLHLPTRDGKTPCGGRGAQPRRVSASLTWGWFFFLGNRRPQCYFESSMTSRDALFGGRLRNFTFRQ